MNNNGEKKGVAVAAVGGISDALHNGMLVIPDQIIDYTSARDNTFFEDGVSHVTHIDFTEPYCEEMRQLLIRACELAKVDYLPHGTYGSTPGPRLEPKAELARKAQDGCTLVGITGMPEAARAREVGLCFATCAVVVYKAAGRGTGPNSKHD